jgi:hypothetical protein
MAKISDLIPDSKNANRGTRRGLKALDTSLRQYKIGRGVLVDKHGKIIAGNKTVERIADIAPDTEVVLVPTTGDQLVVTQRMDLDLDTDPEARALATYDNRVGQLDLDWDVEALNDVGLDVLGDLWTDKELAEIGFNVEEPPEDPGAQIDRAEELREKWGVEPGQLWRLGEHRLICGDCTDRAVVERVMQGEKAKLTVTSPPYAVGKEYEEGVSFDDHLALLRGFTDRTIEITIPGGFIFTNFGEIAALSHASPLTGSKRQCIYLISRDYWQIYHEERGCDLYAMRIWYKPFNRLQQPFWSYHTSIPHHQEWEHIWTWRVPGGDGDRVCDWDISVHAIWDTRNEATEDHPLTRHVAAFPVCLPERAIKAHSMKGEVVYEPFSGSGTTLIACERLGRKCRAIEISPAYCAVAIQRWADMIGQEPVLLEAG